MNTTGALVIVVSLAALGLLAARYLRAYARACPSSVDGEHMAMFETDADGTHLRCFACGRRSAGIDWFRRAA